MSESKIAPGLIGEASEIVTFAVTAAQYGSGLVAGYATPAMIGLMETAAFNATTPYLEPGQTSVGVEVNIRHLAGTPVGMRVSARAELMKVEGRKLYFNVEAWDQVEKIGDGTHIRFIVDKDRFYAGFEKKRQELNKTS